MTWWEGEGFFQCDALIIFNTDYYLSGNSWTWRTNRPTRFPRMQWDKGSNVDLLNRSSYFTEGSLNPAGQRSGLRGHGDTFSFPSMKVTHKRHVWAVSAWSRQLITNSYINLKNLQKSPDLTHTRLIYWLRYWLIDVFQGDVGYQGLPGVPGPVGFRVSCTNQR